MYWALTVVAALLIAVQFLAAPADACYVVSHRSMTLNAMLTVYPWTQAWAQVDIGKGNADTDNVKENDERRELHFDTDTIEQGVKSIEDHVQQAVAHLAACRLKQAREMLGRATHTRQDFFCHTNWADMTLKKSGLRFNRDRNKLKMSFGDGRKFKKFIQEEARKIDFSKLRNPPNVTIQNQECCTNWLLAACDKEPLTSGWEAGDFRKEMRKKNPVKRCKHTGGMQMDSFCDLCSYARDAAEASTVELIRYFDSVVQAKAGAHSKHLLTQFQGRGGKCVSLPGLAPAKPPRHVQATGQCTRCFTPHMMIYGAGTLMETLEAISN